MPPSLRYCSCKRDGEGAGRLRSAEGGQLERREPFGALVSDPYHSIFFLALSIHVRIGDERFMPTTGRNHRSAELEREIARARAELALPEDATLEQIQAAVKTLRELLQRVDRRELEPEDWAMLSAVLRESL